MNTQSKLDTLTNQEQAPTGWIAVRLDNSPQARFRRFIKRIIHKIRPVHYTFVMPTERQEFFIPYLEGCEIDAAEH